MSRLFALALTTLCACASQEHDLSATKRALTERVAADVRVDPQPDLVAAPAADDLEGHVRFALEHNPGLRAAHHGFQGALEKIAQAKSLPDPRFTWIEFVEELQTRTGPHPRRLMLSQTFPWPGVRRLRGEVAGHRAEVLWQRALGRALTVRKTVEDVWYELGWLDRALRVNGDALSLLQQLEPVVQRRIETGGPQEDLLRLQIAVARVEERLEELQDRRPSLIARLSAALGADAAPLIVNAELSEPGVAALDHQLLVELALEHSPTLVALDEEVAGRRAGQDLAGRVRYPDLTLGLDYLQVDPALMAGTPGSGDDPLGVRLSMNVPLWGGRNAAVEREAAHALRAAQLQLENGRNGLRAEVASVLFRRDDAARDLVLYRDALLPRARDTYSLTLTSYRSGAASVRDLIDSEQLTLDFELHYWNACRDVRQHEARLRALVGGSLER